jgi:hypothetical protein
MVPPGPTETSVNTVTVIQVALARWHCAAPLGVDSVPGEPPSSNRLSRFSIIKVKIDRSFMFGHGSGARARAGRELELEARNARMLF